MEVSLLVRRLAATVMRVLLLPDRFRQLGWDDLLEFDLLGWIPYPAMGRCFDGAAVERRHYSAKSREPVVVVVHQDHLECSAVVAGVGDE